MKPKTILKQGRATGNRKRMRIGRRAVAREARKTFLNRRSERFFLYVLNIRTLTS